MEKFLVLTILMVGIPMLLGFLFLFVLPRRYTGKLVFNTEQEYKAFKECVASPSVEIITMETLASAPPIVVQFAVAVSRKQSFPYGKTMDTRFGFILCGIGVAFLVLLLATGTI